MGENCDGRKIDGKISSIKQQEIRHDSSTESPASSNPIKTQKLPSKAQKLPNVGEPQNEIKHTPSVKSEESDDQLIEDEIIKFAEHLSAHVTPEWRKQYISYEFMKEMLYAAQLGLPPLPLHNEPLHLLKNLNPEKRKKIELAEKEFCEYVNEFDEQFLGFCHQELAKINTFFVEKLVEASRKYVDLKKELNSIVPGMHESSNTPRIVFSQNNSNRNKRNSHTEQSLHSSEETEKKLDKLKLAFSEFYLGLVLLHNYQELNFTGFRKILKKHDKLLFTSRGEEWRAGHVNAATFYTCKDVRKLIEETEELVTNLLEGGNRTRAMKRLRVPPLNAHQSPWTTFRVGFFSGSFFVLLCVVLVALIYPHDKYHLSFSVMCRLFRGPFFVCLFIFFIGLNVYGWRTSGVNHVLIFELNPRSHVSEQHLFELAFLFAVIWELSLLGYIFSHIIGLNQNIFPLLNVIVYIAFFVNPMKNCHRPARYWLLRVLSRNFAAPFFRVNFADFWLADQLNSLSILFSDAVFYVCFYMNYFSYSYGPESGAQCSYSSQTYLIARAIATGMPAWIRFSQCLRRYRDDPYRTISPHLVNAGKYSMTFFVILFSTLTELTIEIKKEKLSSRYFWPWIGSLFVSTIYTYLWDIRMDWGFMESPDSSVETKNSKDSKETRNGCESFLLRKEIVYSSPWFYYAAYIENFLCRIMWVFTISLNQMSTIDSDWLITIGSTFELFRRFIWNFFRLENEHLNNCGEFRAVRDISIVPINLEDRSSRISRRETPKRRAELFKTSPYTIIKTPRSS